jgi:4-hydroxy-3-methylbut-2-enyl diphosphate reductase
MEQTYFRRGFGRKKEIEPLIRSEYHSGLVERIRARGYEDRFGEGELQVTVRLAEEFGFCYGVDRAVDYAYETRLHFPDRRVFLLGEIIHNPHINQRLTGMGIVFLRPGADGEFDFGGLTADDVVILPAFGATTDDFRRLQEVGCVLVDTTCGSVLNVWKRVEQYARDGFTSLIHGKYRHEETRATASQALKHAGGHFVIVFDMDEARLVMDYVERAPAPSPAPASWSTSRGRRRPASTPTSTWTASASRTRRRCSRATRWRSPRGGEVDGAAASGPTTCGAHFRSFDTICSATQERQDAVVKMVEGPQGPPDVMLVVGGYNSSNTNHLAILCARHTVTYHIADAECIDPERGTIRFKPAGTPLDAPEAEAEDWIPAGPLVVGITAGASTPNNKIGEALERLLRTRGVELELGEPAAV